MVVPDSYGHFGFIIRFKFNAFYFTLPSQTLLTIPDLVLYKYLVSCEKPQQKAQRNSSAHKRTCCQA